MTKFIVIENQSKQVSQIIDDSFSIIYSGQSTDLEIHEWLDRNLPKNDNIEGIIIELSLGDEDIDSGLLVASHIRLSNFNGSQYLPIYIVTNQEKDGIIATQVIDDSIMTSLLLNTVSCQLLKYQDLLHPEKLQSKHIKTEKELIGNVVNKLRFTDSIDSRHQIANEWGARKLGGHFRSTKNIAFLNYSLYFKYLTKIDSTSNYERDTIFSKEVKVLLVDDNGKKGWKEVLKHILPAKVKLYEDVDSIVGVISENPEIYNEFDLVLLDFYLPSKKGSTPSAQYTKKLLQGFKKINPSTPVIIFTASNKSWNAQELIDWGADGYYVKESPDNIQNSNFSKENTANFINLLKSNKKRKELLAPFWEKTSALINSNIIKNENAKKRTKEMLLLAYDLIHKEKLSSFEKDILKVNFTPFQLAFLAYWSVLNNLLGDIQFNLDNSSLIDFLINGKEVVKEGKSSIKYVEDFKPKSYSFFKNRFRNISKMDWYAMSEYESFEFPVPSKIRPTAPIFFVSAYILSQKDKGLHEELLDRFVTLNKIRNQLDYTHANKYAVENYHFRRTFIMQKDCKSMLDFLYDLLNKKD